MAEPRIRLGERSKARSGKAGWAILIEIMKRPCLDASLFATTYDRLLLASLIRLTHHVFERKADGR
jgi:hypothetical protein